ncbi:MAG TPA: AmmeMemoRadiSam system protein B [Burkholderiales bacterium]|nr:AmmeMemoRadiSam system protein B [Burkholderiales bacterium]
MATVRPAAVAGLFYPGEPRALASEVEELLGGVEQLAPRLGYPKAIIVPHAGYIYSGPVAARAYDEIGPARGTVRRVVLLGPTHRVAVRGLALPGADFFETPLGRIPVDAAALESLRTVAGVVVSAQAHAMEHSLEVQLPFLQRALGTFSLVPLAIGMASAAEVAAVLEKLWGGPETLIVVSTDLSHYHPYEQARAIDGATIDKIERFSTEISHDEACGATPLAGLLQLARSKGLAVERLAACNSGDTAGSKDRVVGYSSFALYEPGARVAAEAAGPVLLRIAREAIACGLAKKAQTLPADPWLRLAGATFVTLTQDGRLRGCIGSLEAVRALGEDVAQNALGAAFRDPRFPPLGDPEWSSCRVEVSLLSAPKPIRFADEADLLAQVVPGEDGIILGCDGRRATFLPQVWESLPDRKRFLAELVRKSGLPSETRLGRCKVWRYRVAKFHER